uniref:Uncharacterized protein n=1 Tax=Tanacetum cinerariifolium TaxID=118510 RepID=A0A6L2LQL4_TANCI|nr:hypothetical protein [Tanacetum cinerariifolium]
MATSVIPISSATSDESVESPPSQVILFGAIPTIILVIPEVPIENPVIPPVAHMVRMTVDTTPTGLRDLVPYSDSDSDSLDDVFPPKYISLLPATSPFVCTDYSKSSGDSSNGPPSQDPYEVIVARWRNKVASHSSDEFPFALIAAPSGYRRRPATLIRHGEAIHFGRPYHSSPDLSSDSSLNSSSDTSSAHTSCHSILDQSLSEYSSPAAIVDDSSAPSAPLSTMYHPTTPESSSRDSSSESCVRSSRKRRRSPTAMVPLLIFAPGALASTRADLLPPRKRFRDSYSSEESIEEDINADVLAGIEADTAAAKATIAREVAKEDKDEYEAESSVRGTVEIRVDRVIELVVADDSFEATIGDVLYQVSTDDSLEVMQLGLDVEVQQLYDHMREILVGRISNIEAGQRQLEMGHLVSDRDRTRMLERIRSLERENLRVQGMLSIERDHINNIRLYMALPQKEFRQIYMDRDEARRRLRRL